MLKKQLKNILMWTIAIGIFAYLFQHYPLSQVLKAFNHVKKLHFFGFSLAYFAFIYVWDAWVMQKVMGRFAHQVSLKDMLVARGVTYLIMIINYPAAQASYAYFLKRRYNIPLFQAFSIFTFILAIDFLWVMSLAFVGTYVSHAELAGFDLSSWVQHTTLTGYAFFALWLCFWRRWPKTLFAQLDKLACLRKLRQQHIFFAFETAQVFDYLKVFFLRTPIHFTIMLSFYVVAQTFGASIPFAQILGNIPIVFFIGSLPLTPGGLGTSNLAMVELLSPHLSSPIFATGELSAKEMMFTLTLLWMFTNYLFKFLIGTFFLRRVSKELFSA